MTGPGRIVLLLFGALIVASVIAVAAGEKSLAFYLIIPAALLSAWAFVGHLVTLDDDAAGEWSNQMHSAAIWRRSLLEVAAKLVVFAAVGAAMISLLVTND